MSLLPLEHPYLFMQDAVFNALNVALEPLELDSHDLRLQDARDYRP
jgi:hypothetical protein